MEKLQSPPLRWRCLLSITVFVMLVGGCLLFFAAQAQIYSRNSVYRNLQASAEDQTRLFHALINDRMDSLSLFTASRHMDEVTRGHGTDSFLRSIKELGRYNRTWLMDSAGKAWSNDGQIVYMKDSRLYDLAMKGHKSVQRVYSPISQEQVFVFLIPVISGGTPIGAVFASLDMEEFRQRLVGSAYGAQSNSFVCDSAGDVLIGSEDEREILAKGNVLDCLTQAVVTEGTYNQVARDFLDKKAGSLAFLYNGEKGYLQYQSVDMNDWMIVNVLDGDVVERLQWELIQREYSLLFFMLLLIVGFMGLLYWQERLKQKKILYDAEHDSLTGLYNRPAFLKRAAALLCRAKPKEYVLCCTDIENFKMINSHFHHDEGDRILKSLAVCAAAYTKQEKGIVCRDAADTFLSIYPNLPEKKSTFFSIWKQEIVAGGMPFRIMFRFGIYVIDDVSKDINNMIDYAVLAQRSIKGQVNCYVAYYDYSMSQIIQREQIIVSEMENALENGEFEIWLQPQYDQLAGVLAGAEALVRWHHPVKGIIGPDEFIPVFEKNGFIHKLDAYVREKCCMLIKRCMEENKRVLPISVNISRVDIYDPAFCKNLQSLIEKYHLDTKALRLEITETACMDRLDTMMDILKELRRQGFFIEMDDFGKGYSSLNYLKDIPIDLIKLDTNFLSSEIDDRRGEIILETVLDMAHRLEIPVLVEGVETKEQSEYLKSKGVSLVQGYFFARPMAEAEFEKLLL